MRHQIKGKKLSRNSSQRKALFKGLINSLFIHGAIETTESKAKAIRGLVDKLITKGKKGTLHSRRLIGAFLQNKKVVNKIVDEFGPLFVKRSSGFSRMIRLGKRRGDDAMMVKLELIEKPVVKVVEEKAIVTKAKDKKEQPVTKIVKTKKK
ncbi:MAG: 50S ribosomal protein L17 [Candidatus Shapirobacteria bacterium]|nr:50S ribosomal protein L17 [Candidatus Shapirobacteria bacterium]